MPRILEDEQSFVSKTDLARRAEAELLDDGRHRRDRDALRDDDLASSPEEVQSMPQKDDTFHEYSAGSDVLPWKGWYENADGEVTAWVDLANRVHIRIDSEVAPECVLAERNAAWNFVRDAVRAVSALPFEPEKTDYWPQSTVSCLMSLAMKELRRTPKGESQDGKDRRKRTLRTLEDVFATSETFRATPARHTTPKMEARPFEDWTEDDGAVLWFCNTEDRAGNTDPWIRGGFVGEPKDEEWHPFTWWVPLPELKFPAGNCPLRVRSAADDDDLYPDGDIR